MLFEKQQNWTPHVKSSQVTFIYIAPLTIQIVTKHKPCAGEGVLSVSLVLLSLKRRVIHSGVNDFSAADSTETIVCLWHSEERRENAISVFVSPVRGHSLALLHVHLLSHNLFSPLSLFLIYRYPHAYSICLIPADHTSVKYLKLEPLFSIVHCGRIV